MKVKLVPRAPDSLETVATVQKAVPLVPGSEDDCCARVLDRTEVVGRDEAAKWLTFLKGLGLAREGSNGFSRIRTDPTTDSLREAFLDGVFGAEDVLSVLQEADRPLGADEVFARFEDTVPQWERHKHPNSWDDVWSERVERLLDWLVLLELAVRTDAGYRAD
ncbi:hypothetical protein [Haloarchaeobius sp. TZWWS8]|uniref:hypothetical protein n=1 Tax=Haloarchaeobius sp. TZWWS8 TaxID=3446121 RepID=UPI003EBBE334